MVLTDLTPLIKAFPLELDSSDFRDHVWAFSDLGWFVGQLVFKNEGRVEVAESRDFLLDFFNEKSNVVCFHAQVTVL